jgi:hypothetical protein
MKRYVALGSSMAAGPGIRPRAAGAPWAAGRSAGNYPHVVAEGLNLDLEDVTYSGATTAHVLADAQRGAPPQIDALNGSETLVTVTIGGNDVGYLPLLMAGSLPPGARRLPLLGNRISELLDRAARDRALAEVFDSLCAVGRAVRERAPHARVFLRRLPHAAAAGRCPGAAPVGARRRPGPACGYHPGTTDGGSRGGNALRGCPCRREQSRPSRVVGRAVDDEAFEIRCVAAGSTDGAAFQRRRDACGGGVGYSCVVRVSRWSPTTCTAPRCCHRARG